MILECRASSPWAGMQIPRSEIDVDPALAGSSCTGNSTRRSLSRFSVICPSRLLNVSGLRGDFRAGRPRGGWAHTEFLLELGPGVLVRGRIVVAFVPERIVRRCSPLAMSSAAAAVLMVLLAMLCRRGCGTGGQTCYPGPRLLVRRKRSLLLRDLRLVVFIVVVFIVVIIIVGEGYLLVVGSRAERRRVGARCGHGWLCARVRDRPREGGVGMGVVATFLCGVCLVAEGGEAHGLGHGLGVVVAVTV